MSIRKRFYFLISLTLLVILAGSLGYYILFDGKPRFIDCMYMTVITLTSVGYGEIIPVSGNPAAEIFTMILITCGMGAILYGISTLTAIIIEGELSGIIRKRKMEKAIKKLVNHYIVCGGGQTGFPLVNELIKNKETVVVIESDEEILKRCMTVDGLFYINGDATDDKHLFDAGIEHAAGIITSLPSDKDNLYITMTARMIRPDIRIISRLIAPQLEAKLKKAGADSVVSPNFIGAMRMASEMIRPAAVDFLDVMLRSNNGDLRIHQLTVSPKAAGIGKTIAESDLKERYDLMILGIKHASGEIEFNPPEARILENGFILIVMGKSKDIARAKRQLEYV